MASTVLTASSPSSTRQRSLEAYVLPHLVDVTPGVHAIVKCVLVEPHGVVRRGQTVAVLDRLLTQREEDPDQLVIEAPAAGLVTRCWATAGDIVAGAWPIVSIASAENVFVVARFAPDSMARIRVQGAASVRLIGAKPEAFPATIVTVVEAPDEGAVLGGRDARSIRVVVTFSDAPAKLLWPGTPVHVEVDP